ncbi:hypothetical protein F4555_000488 [Mobiluncus mulieris]|uniref:Uncharacterized protein n=1 Tax=Mobiluncus mulieris TaxID=2052 RepID=A0A8G2HRD4_9ACTO|nr:hypothetical protein [Mobiluncus mulieris]MBB5845692.1 hypothetical protein [Mobiluncus mulieris]STO15644.1 Uncharacterised protein [Mobiluncus mulieris]
MNETENPSITPAGEADSVAPPSAGWVMPTAAAVHEEPAETPRDSLEASAPSPITSLDFGDGKVADKMPDTAKPKTTPQLKEKLGLVDLTFSIVFIVVGLAAIAIALGAKIDLWELNLALLGTAGVVLLLGAFVTARK